QLITAANANDAFSSCGTVVAAAATTGSSIVSIAIASNRPISLATKSGARFACLQLVRTVLSFRQPHRRPLSFTLAVDSFRSCVPFLALYSLGASLCRSEELTSELQSRFDLVSRLLLA